MMRKSKYTLTLLQPIVNKAESIAGVLRELRLARSGGNHRYISSQLKLLGIDTSHFTGQSWSKGKKLGEDYFKIARPLNELLVKNSNCSSTKLKQRLLNNGLKTNKCEDCGIVEWRGKKISLELHHINEKHNDNRLSNLKILCPNCHSAVDKFN